MRIRLANKLSINEIALAIGGKVNKQSKGQIIEYISTDSRELLSKDLYFPFTGSIYDGEDFYKEVKRLGGFAVSKIHSDADINVEDTGKAFMFLAKYYKRLLPDLKYTVAITGSVGKTTTKDFLSIIASQKYRTHATMENYNNGIGLPATILSAPLNTEIMVLEMGMNHAGEIKELSECAEPDVGIITKIGTAHIGNLGSKKDIAKAKLEILHGLAGGDVIIPYGEPLLSEIANGISFSTTDRRSDYFIEKEGSLINIIRKKKSWMKGKFISDKDSILECLCCAVAAADTIGVPKDDVISGVSSISSVNLRQKHIFLKKIHIIDDSYNSSLESVIAGINELSTYTEYSRRSALLGQIFELGDNSAEIHYRIGAYAKDMGICPLYLFGPDTVHIKRGATDNGISEKMIFTNYDLGNPELTAKQIKENSIQGEIMLCKGSHKTNLSRIIKLLKKGENYG